MLHIRAMHGVAPGFLGAVEGLVGPVHQLFKAEPGALVQRGHTNAHGDRNANTAFVPPKANELDSMVRPAAFGRAELGT